MIQVKSLYLHIPFCKHLCNYCDFYKRKFDSRLNQFEEFHAYLSDSVKVHNQFLLENGAEVRELETLYLGGGTPSLWGENGAKFLPSILPGPLVKDAEFTMEVDPGTWNSRMIEAFQKIGLNRISIGTQTLDSDFLKIMDRAHSLEESKDLLSFVAQEKFNFSLDFLLGIPFSNERKRNIKKELDLLLSYGPKHISLYILNARSKYPHIQNLPEDEYIREEYLFVSEYLRSHGFHHYEVSNFALPGFESEHNMRYWRGENVAALGPTGTGYLTLGAEEALRYKWKVSEASFEIEKLGQQELSLEKTYLSLRTYEGFIPPKGSENLMVRWVQENYAFRDNHRIKLTALGFLMLDSLMDDLFRWEASQ